MKIDIHVHCIPKDYISAVMGMHHNYPDRTRTDSSGQVEISYPTFAEVASFATACPGKWWRPLAANYYDPDVIVKDMDKSGRDIAVLSPSPRLFHYGLEGDLAEKTARTVNDGISHMVRKRPNRLMGMATVPLQNPSASIRELERAVKDLGLSAVEIGSNINGSNLDEPGFLPFFQKAQDLGILVFVHPFNVAGIERMGRYHLSNLIGNPTDTSLAIASLIYGRVIENLPGLKLCFAHAGGSMPYLLGRLDHGYKVRPECQAAIPKAPSNYFKRLHFDCLCHSKAGLLHLIHQVGCERVLLGSDYPADMSDPDPIATVANLNNISERDRQRIWGDNAAALLGIDSPSNAKSGRGQAKTRGGSCRVVS